MVIQIAVSDVIVTTPFQKDFKKSLWVVLQTVGQMKQQLGKGKLFFPNPEPWEVTSTKA